MPQDVHAVIVAGGVGSRLQPLTTRHPKHLLNVGGAPFLAHQISRLAAAGVSEVVLATSYRAGMFEPVLGDGRRWGVRLHYVQEVEPLGTAGAIRNAAGALTGEPEAAVVVLNGDILSGHDLRGQVADFERRRREGQVDVSLHLVKVADARPFGSVPTGEDGRVTAFAEKSERPVSNQVNAGCYIFRRRVVDEIPAGRVVSVERETFPALVEAGRLVVGFVDNAYWRDVGTPAALVAASSDLVLGIATSPAVDAEPEAANVSQEAVVSATATVNGGSVVAEGAKVGDGARISGSVVMAGAVIGRGAVVTDSAIGPGAQVGDGAELVRVTMGDDACIVDGTLLRDQRVACGATR